MSSAWRALAVGAVCLSGSALAGNFQPVTVEIVAPDGRTFREFPVDSRDGALRSYLEAEKGARYQVRVRNRSGERLGLVIAVDGRNIINGKRSELARSEPMYVIDAWDTQSYAGWRASLETINEFYFTDWKHSYAEAFGDRSARGVIAVAVYREAHRQVYDRHAAPRPQPHDESSAEARAEAPAAGRDSTVAKDERSRAAEPGTGFGEEVYSPARRVEFHPQRRAASRHFFKYEWRDALCRRGVVECDGRERNRFWDEDERFGYAPYPPRNR